MPVKSPQLNKQTVNRKTYTVHYIQHYRWYILLLHTVVKTFSSFVFKITTENINNIANTVLKQTKIQKQNETRIWYDALEQQTVTISWKKINSHNSLLI